MHCSPGVLTVCTYCCWIHVLPYVELNWGSIEEVHSSKPVCTALRCELSSSLNLLYQRICFRESVKHLPDKLVARTLGWYIGGHGQKLLLGLIQLLWICAMATLQELMQGKYSNGQQAKRGLKLLGTAFFLLEIALLGIPAFQTALSLMCLAC